MHTDKSPHLGDYGGQENNPKEFSAGNLRADLCEVAQSICFTHGQKIIERLLRDYNVTKRRSIKKEIAVPDP